MLLSYLFDNIFCLKFVDIIFIKPFRALYFKHSLLNWIKIDENHRMSSKLKVLPNNYLKLLERSEMKIEFKKIKKKSDFSVKTYVEKSSYFQVAPPGHTIAYKNVDNLFENNLSLIHI